MSLTDESVALDYLTPLPDTFWRWSDGDREVCWKDGSLIVFRNELSLVLQHLAKEGLPPLGPVLLLLAALKPTWNQSNESQRLLASLLPDANSNRPGMHHRTLEQTLGELSRVNQLPPDLLRTVSAKAVIAEMVFEDAEISLPAAVATDVVNLLQSGLGSMLRDAADDSPPPYGFAGEKLVHDLGLLRRGLSSVNEATIRARMKTGLGDLPEPIETEEPLPPPVAVRRLIAELQDDPELAGLARTARRLIAATSIPRSISRADEQEAGGLSDISNRGPFDRLLLSELANDGLTLAVRVAMNEALYLRRETPPGPPATERGILLDAGIRSWGLPRLYATSLALAFTASSDVAVPVWIARAKGDSLAEVDFTSRDGLSDHLAVLEADLTPAAALEPYFRRLNESSDPTEAVLIVAEETASDPDFERTLNAIVADGASCVLASCSRDGAISISQRSTAGHKQIRKLLVEPDEILARGGSLVDASAKRDELPAIFAQPILPLLLPHQISADRVWYIEGFGVHALTRDGRLMRWTDPLEAAYEVSNQMPKGELLWASSGPTNGRISCVVGGPHVASLIHIGQNDFSVEIHELPRTQIGPIDCYAAHGDFLFAVCLTAGEVRVHSLADGELLYTFVIPATMTWIRDRFFIDRSGWYSALAFDGQKVRLEPLPPVDRERAQEQADHRQWVAVFDAPWADGQVAVTHHGDLLNVSTSEPVHVELPRGGDTSSLVLFNGITPDARRIGLIRGKERRVEQTIVCDHGKPARLTSRSIQYEDRVFHLANTRSVRNKFSSVGRTSHDRLVLITPKGGLAVIVFENGRVLLRSQLLSKAKDNPEIIVSGTQQNFQDIANPVGRYRMRRAQFPNGSRAFVDSRGLLHLCPADPTAVQVSLVLVDGELSGWCSDGTLWGRRYFTGEAGDDSTGTITSVYNSVIKPFVAALHD